MDGIMGIVGYPLGWVMWLAYKIIPVYSVALIIFTVIMRAIMLPMSVKQHKNSIRMQILKPKVDAINKKYEKNPQKAQEEVNKLYEKEGYNPFGGCSTLFLQLPILYGLIDVIYKPMTHLLRLDKDVILKAQEIFEKAGAKLVEGKNTYSIQIAMLGKAEEYKTQLIDGLGAEVYEKMTSIDLNLFGINLGAIPEWSWNLLVLIPILSFVTALASSLISMKMSADQAASGKGCMYAMTFGMPLMSAWFSMMVPAGVGLYWIIGNILAGVQTVVLRKVITQESLEKELERQKAKGKKKKKSKFMTKLLEAQAQAAAQQGAASEQETADAKNKQKALKEAEQKLNLTDQQKLAEARRRYAEKYGDDIK